MTQQKVSDLTTEELLAFIRDAVVDVLYEHDIVEDPDEGLELREDFALKLEASIKAVEAGAPTISAEELARKHSLSW